MKSWGDKMEGCFEMLAVVVWWWDACGKSVPDSTVSRHAPRCGERVGVRRAVL